jgi:hypothetical protein
MYVIVIVSATNKLASTLCVSAFRLNLSMVLEKVGSCEHGDEPSGTLKLLGIF